MRTLRHFAVFTVLVLVLSGCANSLFYYPNDRVYLTPEDAALSYEDVYFESLDKTRLHGWFMPAKGEAWGTVIHFHGNAGNITAHLNMMGFIPYKGLNLFMFDYRGYGKSQGHPNRKGVYEDSLSALRYVLARPDVDKQRVFLLGQSLGGANAIAVAASLTPETIRALVVDSSFYSYRSIVKDKIGTLPVLGWFKTPLSLIMATDSYHSGDMIGSISPTPVMILHGTNDRVIPFHHGEQLFERTREPKTFVRVEGADHIETLAPRNKATREKVVEFFRQAVREPVLSN